MNSIAYIGSIGRRMGKTYAICKVAKEIGATVICRSKKEAERVQKEYGVKATYYDAELRGTSGPYLMDTDAVSQYAHVKDNEISNLQLKLDKKEREIGILRDIIIKLLYESK